MILKFVKSFFEVILEVALLAIYAICVMALVIVFMIGIFHLVVWLML